LLADPDPIKNQVKQPGHYDRHELAATGASPSCNQYDDGRDGGSDQRVAPTLPEGFPQEDPHKEIDYVWHERPKDQQPQVHPGISEDPSKKEDRSGHLPEDHRFGSHPIEGSVGKGVGDGVLFPGYVLELVGKLLEKALRLEMKRLENGVFDPVAALELTDQQLAVCPNSEAVGTMSLGQLETLDQRLVLSHVVGRLSDRLGDLVYQRGPTIFDPVQGCPDRGPPRVAAGGAVGVDNPVAAGPIPERGHRTRMRMQ